MALKQHSKVVWPGFSNTPEQRHTFKVGRNDPCPCESGKKYKSCHEREGAAFLQKLEKEREKERRKQLRQSLKERGVPWFKRLFFIR